MKLSTFRWTLHGLGLAVTLVAVGLAYGLLFRPMGVESQQLRLEAAEKRGYLAQADGLAARNGELKGRLDESERLLAELKKRIPESAQEGDFLAQLADAAETADVEMIDYRPGAAIEKERHSEMKIALSARGRYAAMCRFLDALESLPRLCHVTRMELDAGGPTAETYGFELTLQVYFRRSHVAVAAN